MLQYLRQNPNISIGILVILYAVGISCVKLNVHEDFLLLTPLNLLTSLALVLVYHTDWSRKSIAVLFTCFIVGYGFEVIGVNTGLIFGEYSYGRVLGLKIFDTPLMIGVNWVMLVYCSAALTNRLLPSLHFAVKAVISAAVMVLLDFFIEPVAVARDFWTWTAEYIPLQNYLAWYIISFVLLLLFHISHPKIQNKVAIALLILQFVFFIAIR